MESPVFIGGFDMLAEKIGKHLPGVRHADLVAALRAAGIRSITDAASPT